jgi:hypothetical protein
MPMKEITAKSYTLLTETGNWLGQVILTSDGVFAGVTDWGNLSFAWRAFSGDDFVKFIIGLDIYYFSRKMSEGLGYICHNRKTDIACDRFAEKILPELQRVLRAEMERTSKDKL